jgi:hypothetical protein
MVIVPITLCCFDENENFFLLTNLLFLFIIVVNVPFENDHAERIIRDGVIKRKNGYSNRSKNGTETQAILMSVFQTLKQRKLNHVNSFV